ncbi:hypothetical protein B0P06_006121 [Clostridium saccharoperbutylacetonicum]|uniref:Uncharacterized protein n=1 Tax=Clostridium saccharoperbutylacetonicum N1-4(HMT) TaxID=931276 RepID=M1M1V6_9CLOT|nr:hypothetical protein [Clostridium saccharoperbutylacetonicum]AGF59605.1 hypothetical protein Cspa_135p00450 [Clostridium saccharoperbutylacetonicum N1-4(HMT)]NRT64538.1 hypothetical protein [Clostridium saccharoperbutylacetonicum]NSB29013.1 hypothetical protein [Clostridium saccharoperbutylacetonicum]NSB46228.1 hypothetical protein [Clostridium saccharoperbutylacetonicum]
MSYLLKDVKGLYYNLSGQVFEIDALKNISKYGFEISDLLRADKELIKNKKLVSINNVSQSIFHIKNSYGFLLIKVNSPFTNVCFEIKQNVLVSEDGVIWLNYLDEDNYIVTEFNVSLNSFTSITNLQKSELLKMKEYINNNTKEISFINNNKIKYIFMKLNNKLDRIYYRNYLDETTVKNIDMYTEISKNSIKIKNLTSTDFSNLCVNVTNVNEYKKDSLEEF